jgi:MoaA/NifB/PqqE/SkfB family radical SAM enzyme
MDKTPRGPEAMSFLTSLGLSITTKCPVACLHCIIEAGPGRTEEMSAEDAEEWLRQAARYRNGHIKSVVITGGEPFYNVTLLRRLLSSAFRNKLVPAVVTNAFWAKELNQAIAMLQSLPQLKMLCVSTDIYHQKAIPFQNVVNAIQAARELGIRHNVAVCFLNEDDPSYLALRRKLEDVVDRNLIRAAPVYPAGRAMKQFEWDGDWMTKEPPSGPCTAADFPTIFPDGRVIGCHGIVKELPATHPLNLGSLREETLAQILDKAETNTALHMMRVWGPGKLMQLVAATGVGERLPKQFHKHACCDLCYALVSDHELRNAANKTVEQQELTEKTAYARLYYMGEEDMIHKLSERGSVESPTNSGGAPEKETEPAFLENIGFLITYKCQVACPHCIIGAGPNRTEQMEREDLFSWIEQASAYRGGRIKTICFTGGEPFYDLERLRQMTLLAVSRGMLPTVVTNAFWAESPAKAVETLKSMPALRVISVSTDSHHLAQIPFSRVENALLAAKELGLNCSVAVCTEDVNSREYQDLLEQLQRIVAADCISTAITFPVGRAAGFLKAAQYGMTHELPNAACPSADTPVVFPDGRVVACMGPVVDLCNGHPLLLGNLREKSLDYILDKAEMNPILHILRVWGPGRLYEILQEKGYGSRLPRQFIKDSICNLCYSMIADDSLHAALNDLARDNQLKQKIAFGRQYYLSETAMVDMMESEGLLDS